MNICVQCGLEIEVPDEIVNCEVTSVKIIVTIHRPVIQATVIVVARDSEGINCDYIVRNSSCDDYRFVRSYIRQAKKIARYFNTQFDFQVDFKGAFKIWENKNIVCNVV